MLLTNDTVGDLVDRIMGEKGPLGFDTETTGFSPVSSHIVGFSVSCSNRHGVYIPMRHERILEEEVQVKQGRKKLGPPRILRTEPHPANFTKDVADTIIRAIVESERPVVMHNASFDLAMSSAEGWEFPQQVICTRLAKWLLFRGMTPLGKEPLGLKTLAKKELQYDAATFEQTSDPRGFQYTDPEIAAPYAADDARNTLRLWYRYEKEMTTEWKEYPFLRELLTLEMPVARVVAHMRGAGILVDREMLVQCHAEVVTEQARLQKRLDELIEGDFPTSKTQKMSRMLFDDLKWWNPRGLERGEARAKDNPLGFYSTSEEVLVNQLDVALDKRGKEVALLLLRWRKLDTMRARYTLSIADALDTDGRLRTNFNQAATDTGRFSSSKPVNLQNIPRPSDDEAPDVWVRKLPKIRAAFMAPPGRKLIDIDYSQIELRLMAHYSQDPRLLAAYRTWRCGACKGEGQSDVVLHSCPACGAPDISAKGKKAKMALDGTPQEGLFCLGMDIHQLTAEQVGVDRQASKAINFGLIYGMGAWKLGNDLGIPEHEAGRYIARYFNAYPGVRQYHRKVERQLLDHWFVRTLTGRHRRFDRITPEYDDDGRPRGKYGHAWRSAVNATIQGSAADLMKLAMRNLYLRMEKEGTLGKRFWILSTVHDELICEADEDYAKEAAEIMRYEMENAVVLRVPLVADPAIGDRWSDIH